MNKLLLIASIFLFSTIILFSQSKISFTEISDQLPSNLAGTIKWTSNEIKGWDAGLPLIQITKDDKSKVADGWVTFTDENILIKIVVSDQTHNNSFDEFDLWKGDAVQIGLDMRNDAWGRMDKNTSGINGTDDATVCFGKSGDSTFGVWYFSGLPAIKYGDKMPKENINITRNEKNKTTTYLIKLTWANFGINPGITNVFGMSVQINDINSTTEEQHRYTWGEGAGGTGKPGLHKKVGIIFPEKNNVQIIDFQNSIFWSEEFPIEATISIASTNNITISSDYGNAKTNISYNTPNKLKLYKVILTPSTDSKNNTALIISLNDNFKKSLLYTKSINIELPNLVINDFYGVIDSLKKKNNNKYFLRHLTSIKAIVVTELARMEHYQTYDSRTPDRVYGYIKSMTAGLRGNAGKYETYLEGKRSLIFTFISSRDGSLQYYKFMPPKTWDITKTYPLYVELHGAGDEPNPIDMLNGEIGEGSSTLYGYSSTISYFQQMGTGYHVYPWARGNSRYQNFGESDVWDAIKDANDNFKIDENHRYLFGFSMGGGGTWTIGIRTPDYWAAIAIFSGAPPKDSYGLDLGKNASYLPVFIACGDKDGLVSNIDLFKKELEKFGNNPEIHVIPGMRHNYRIEEQKMGYDFVTKYTRTRPNKFSYVADSKNRTGVWGIKMTYDQKLSSLPEFTCEINNSEINIQSSGTKKLEIDFSNKGMNIQGKKKITWNGKIAYEGIGDKVVLE